MIPNRPRPGYQRAYCGDLMPGETTRPRFVMPNMDNAEQVAVSTVPVPGEPTDPLFLMRVLAGLRRL